MNDTYSAYLASEAWAEKRRQRLALSKFRCEVCHLNTKLQVHHLTYERIFREEMKDLMVLCELHHEAAEELVQKGVLKRIGNPVSLRNETLKFIAPSGIYKTEKEVYCYPKYKSETTQLDKLVISKKMHPRQVQEMLKNVPEIARLLREPFKKYKSDLRKILCRHPQKNKILSNAILIHPGLKAFRESKVAKRNSKAERIFNWYLNDQKVISLIHLEAHEFDKAISKMFPASGKGVKTSIVKATRKVWSHYNGSNC